MTRVVCAIGESGSPAALRAAVDYCREHHAELRLVGIVPPSSAIRPALRQASASAAR